MVIHRYRPGWAIVLGIIGTITILIGALLFLVKKEDMLTIGLSPSSEGGSTVVISGGGAEQWLILTVQRVLAGDAGSSPTRECPNCKKPMAVDVGVCPHCGTESQPLTLHAGVWWVRSSASGEWTWIEPKERVWRFYKDGTPTDPNAKDRTPSRVIDPALVKPPDPSQQVEEAPVPELKAQSSAAELEQLAGLHERGALTDEEFQAAKAKLLGL